MWYRIAADAVVVLHLAFVCFVVFGGFLALRWPRLAWVHVPVAIYGAAIEFWGWICPLTPLENSLRRAAGEIGYSGGFIERYIVRILYPPGLTPTIQVLLGIGVVGINVVAYGAYIRKRRRLAARSETHPADSH